MGGLLPPNKDIVSNYFVLKCLKESFLKEHKVASPKFSLTDSAGIRK